MHRIDTPTAQKDKWGAGKNGFTDGDPATGIKATSLNAALFDSVQEEICNVIEKNGITLDNSKNDQLFAAIQAMIDTSEGELGLGTAAFHDVQESRDDTTPGRVLVNGGALALRSVAASADRDIKDANDLPVNSVSFCYASATHSPGYEATILDVAGLNNDYRVQYAASYADGGKQLKFRTYNGDNKTWGGSWTTVLTNYGGSVDYLDNAKYFATKAEYWQGAGGFAAQYINGTAPFFVPGFTAPAGVSNYLPLVKGSTTIAGIGWGSAVSFGILRSGKNDFGSAAIHIIGDSGQSGLYTFDASGNFNSQAGVSAGTNIVAAQAVYESGGLVRVYSSNNPPPATDLSNYYTKPESNSRYAMNVQLVGVGGVGTYAFCTYKYGSIAPNQLVSGGDLFISGVGAQKSSSGWGDKSLIIDQSGTLSGTWMCCGAQPGPSGSDIGATLYFRIA
ncbi:hypothetical protein [Enterobacter roggenkampii]|uniref:hypothetical protein n=1 Tax=Enterobacter roggenkampii TaxID=1812935 RepID=UPI001F3DEA43|nr:hypothetical protein [Enterobacter roggenkampii]